MINNLGYACINMTLGKKGSFKTTTATSASKLSEQDRFNKIQQLTRQNFDTLYDIMKFNIDNNIHLYRVSSDMCPLNTHEICNYDFTQDAVVLSMASKIKEMAIDNNIRLSIHPSQFLVLSSDKEHVVRNSIIDLEYHYKLMQLLGIEICCIHVGGKTGGIELAKQRFINTFNALPQHLKDIIHLENDDKSFNVSDTLDICEEINIPMILDFHHDRCLPSRDSVEYCINRICATWKGRTPKAHLSSGKTSVTDRSHADYIQKEDYDYVNSIWCGDLMLECKQKDLALFRLISK